MVVPDETTASVSGIPATCFPLSAPSRTSTVMFAQPVEDWSGVEPASPSQEIGWMAVIRPVG